MDSFMTWIGGKKALRGKIVEQFPEPGTYGRYIEVFGGAGWVLFSSDSHAKMEVYNDVNGNLVCSGVLNTTLMRFRMSCNIY